MSDRDKWHKALREITGFLFAFSPNYSVRPAVMFDIELERLQGLVIYARECLAKANARQRLKERLREKA